MKTPYSHVVNLSLQRELPSQFVLEVAYIGRFGRHQLQQIDLAQPLDLVDSKSGIGLFRGGHPALQAEVCRGGKRCSHSILRGYVSRRRRRRTERNPEYLQPVAAGQRNRLALHAGHTLFCTPAAADQTNRFWPRQYASLYAWSSIGSSNYNAAQVTLQRKMSRGVQMELSYTFSKSLDMGSDAERTMFSSSTGTSCGQQLRSHPQRLEAAPELRRSDFDVRHLVTGSWVWELPVRPRQTLLGGSSTEMDRVIGNWQTLRRGALDQRPAVQRHQRSRMGNQLG